MKYLLRYFPYRCDGSAIKILVILASLDKKVVLNVGFHLFPGGHEMIVPLVNLVVPFRPSRIYVNNKIALKYLGINQGTCTS